MPRGTFDRSARKGRTRAALLDAAARVYAEHGFAGATLDDVAEEAGFTKGAIYANFGSKSGLLVALFEEYVAAEIAEQVALFDRSETSWRRPLAGSDRYMDELDTSPDLFRLLIEFWLLAQRDDELRASFAGGLAALRATFAAFHAQTAPERDEDAERHFGDITAALALGLGMSRLADPEHVPRELLGTTLSILIRALERDPELARAKSEPAERG
jgi:AcrR family transcriptional regulator